MPLDATTPAGAQINGGALRVTSPDGLNQGGALKTYEPQAPGRMAYLDWMAGADDTFERLATGVNNSLPIEISQMNTGARSAVFVCEGTPTGASAVIQFSRDGENNWYEAVASTALTASVTQINIPASAGYDLYARSVLTLGGSGDQLDWKNYLVGRGG